MLELAILWGAVCWAILSMIQSQIKRLPNWWCMKCLSFWITLIITFNPLIAAGASLLVYFIDKNTSIKL